MATRERNIEEPRNGKGAAQQTEKRKNTDDEESTHWLWSLTGQHT
jgi:hypothetical protein